MSIPLLFAKRRFNPRRLFAAGEQGVWYDPSDFSTMFQDSAGTTPVTAIEQPVGLILDKSGRGNHASQSTTTSRPILRQDATGRHYLEFDGTDDWMAISNTAMPVNDFVCVSGVNVVSSTSTKVVIARTYYWGAFQVAIRANNAVTNASKLIVGVGRTGIDEAQASSTANADAGNIVLLGSYNRANVGAATNLAAENNTPYTQTISYDANDAATLGAFRNTSNVTAGRMNGRLYGVVLRNAATNSTNKSNLVRWMAAKTGVTL